MRRFLKPFFSKMTFGAVLLLLQAALLIMPIAGFLEMNYATHTAIRIISAVVIIFEINRDADSGYKLIWIAILAVFPVFGIFLYVYVHSDIIVRFIRKKIGSMSQGLSQFSAEFITCGEELKKENSDEYGIFKYLSSSAHAPCFNCGTIKYFSLGDDMYKSLIEDIKNAKKYIFLEFFIINENDRMWQELLSILTHKATQGVEIRMLYDAMGSLVCTGRNFEKRLCRVGIKCHAFSPVKPFISTYHNNRDHRKMVIIDGKYAYTGGINLADEYINEKARFGHWKDTAIRAEGSVAAGFLLMYLKMWNFVTSRSDNYLSYADNSCSCNNAEGYISAFDDNPLDVEFVTRNVYLHIINSSKDYVYINTPYLIPDDALLQALKFAAARGVDVRIMMPHIPDKWYAFAVGRSYYPELLKAGVRIFEYTPGFLHAKSTVSDDCRAYIGSANYDFRSLYLHYECGVYIYKNPVICEMKKDYGDTLNCSHEMTFELYKELNLFYRLAGRVLRFFSALM